MKSKFFILTLMMMFCSMAFGQTESHDYWGDFNPHHYANSMQLLAALEADDVNDPAQLQIAAFCGEERRSSVVTPTQMSNGKYLVQLQIYGGKSYNVDEDSFPEEQYPIVVKIYDGTSDYELTSFYFEAYQVMGDLTNPHTFTFNYVAKIGETNYATLQAAFDNVDEGETITIFESIEEGTITLPQILKNVTVTASDNVVVKNTVITTPSLGHTKNFTIDYDGLTFNEVNFENSRMYFQGWANDALYQEVSIKNIAVTDCNFNDIANPADKNLAAVHFNVNKNELVNLTFKGNVIDGITGGERAGLYGDFTGIVEIKNNNIKNTSGSSMVIGYNNADITISDNELENWGTSGNGRAIRLSENDATVASTVSATQNAMICTNAPEEFVKATESNTTITLSENYWNGKSPREEGIVNAEGAVIKNYYQNYEKNTHTFSDLFWFPYGTITIGYTTTEKIWGEGTSNSNESFVVKLYADETLLGQSSLNNINNIIDGDVYVTWSIPFNPTNTGYWTTEWSQELTPEVLPTTVKLYADGELVAENVVQMNAPDNLNPIQWTDIFVAKIGDKYYTSLAKAFEAADNNSTIELLKDVVLPQTITVADGKVVTLDLAGKAISTAWEDESAGKHYYAFDNKGTLTITGNGTINARGNFNYGTMTLQNGTINAIDGNGGYAVRSYSGKFTMNGGTIATTLEDDNEVNNGGYDATPVRIDEGATFEMNDGNINNICDFTFAIENHGTTVIGENVDNITSVHTTISNNGTMTVNGGTFTCDGLDGITAHVLLAAAGEATINGGTFNGKDNYNGFNVNASEDAKVNITGGKFESVHSGSLYGKGTIAVSGGTFFDAVPENYCAEGYIPTANNDGTYGVKLGSYVARIGETKYETIADAIAAAQEGRTVTILAGEYTTNINVNKAITLEGETDAEGNKLVAIEGKVSANTGATIKNLKVNNNKTGEYDCAMNVNGKDITIDNVELTGYNTLRYCYANGDITIKNSVINGNYFAVHFDGSTGGNIIIENTDITGWCSYAGTIGTVSYTDCHLDNGNYAGHRYYNANVNFTDCTFKEGINLDLTSSNENVTFIDNAEDGTVMTMDQVKALFDPADVMASEVTLNGVKATYAASANGKYYNTLQEAINDLPTDGATYWVYLRSENVLTAPVTIPDGKKMTINLNGFDIIYTSEVLGEAMITNYGEVSFEGKEGDEIVYTYTGQGDPNYGKGNYTISNAGSLSVETITIANRTQKLSHACYAIDNNSNNRPATLVIKSGKVVNDNNYAIRQIANKENNITISGGEVVGTRAIWLQLPGSDVNHAPIANLTISDDAVLTATGESEDYKLAIYSYNYGNDTKNVTINISGGTFNGDIALTGGKNKENVETLNITGGTFNGKDGDVYSYASDDKAVEAITITGGTFSSDYAEIYSLDDGFVFVYDETTQMYGLQSFSDLEISDLDELIAFRNAVNAGNTFSGKIVTVTAGINMASETNWIPIGTKANPFNGTFDGGNNVISNLNVVGEANQGLFGYANTATIKNVKIENANVKGTDCVGVIAGQVYSSSLIDNCHVSGSIKVEGQTNVGGIVGKYYTKVTNSSVIGDGVATSYVKGTHYAANFEGGNIGGIMGHGGENNTFTNNTVKKITISGTRKVGGIVGVTDQYTDVTSCLVENVNIETTATADYAENNKAKAGHGSIVGSYTTLGTNDNGTVTNCVVKNVIFVNPNDVYMSAGPITGGAREGMIAPTGVTASGNLIYMSTISDNTTNTYLMHAVAKIGETKYYTLFDAVAAAQGETTTITLISDASEVFAINNTTTAITLDLNGKKLTGSIAPSKANLTVNNGTIESVDPEYSAIEINEGVLALNNVNITSQRHAVRIDGAVTATIDGGTYKPTATSGTRHAVNVSGGANVTIKAGTFVGPKGTAMDSGSAVCVQAGATVTIEGGDFSGGKNATLGVSGTMIVKGGTFDQDPSAYVAPGYACEQLEANKYIVKISSTEIFYTAEGVETTADQAAYSLIFTITNAEQQEVSVKIGSKKPAASNDIHLITPTTATINDVVYDVTSVARQGFRGTNFTKITISEGVTSLAYESLSNTQCLTDLVLPSTLGYIDNAVFNGNEGQYVIKTVTILAETAPTAAAQTSIPQWMSSKVLVVKNGTYQDYSTAMAWSRFGNIIAVGSTKEIAGKDDKYSLIATITSMDPMECSIKIGQKPAVNSNAELVIPETVDFADHLTGYEFNAIKVTEIEDGAFSSTLYFTGDFTVPQYVRTIGTSAFNTCFYVSNPDLRGTLKLNEGLLSIGSQAFKNAYFKGDLNIPASVENIVANAFQLAQFGGTLTINSNVNYQQAFNGSDFTKLVIAEGVEEITSYLAFAGMKSLKEVVIPLTLETLGIGAFYDVESIESVMTYATNVPQINYNNNNTTYAHPFHATVLENATLWVVGESYDDVIAYKEAVKWMEFANIHLYGAVAAVEGQDYYYEYLTFDEAYEAVESGQTITLLANVKLEERLTVENNITLNLNGHNINAPFTDSYGAIYVKKGAELTIDGEGDITSSGIAIGTYGKVNINGGNITTTGSDAAALYVFYYSSDYEGTANINGGYLNTVWNCGILNISGGQIGYLDTSSELNVTGGEITEMYARDGSDASGEYLMNITDINVFVNPVQVPEGYEFKAVSENVYKVVLAQVTQTTQLGKGWNWFSTYVETDLEALQAALGENGYMIKTHGGGYTTYDGEDWFGSLNKLMPERMYQIKVVEKQEISLDGKLIVSSEHPITIKKGWNPIGYNLNESQSVEDALKSINAVEGDRIVAQQGYAEYDGEGWYGSLNTLMPGKGYMYHSKYDGQDDNILIYSPSSKSELRANVTTDGNRWMPTAGQYANNMTMTAMVNVEGNYEIAAFVGGEVRGSARPIYVEALDSYIYFLTIHGDETEEMSFRLYDIDTDTEYMLGDRINYSNDAIVGSLTEPYMFNLEMLGIGENSAENFNIYPNPTTTNAGIRLNATCDKVEVYNALGVKVAEYSNVDTIDALETAGIYVIRITDNNNVKHCRLIVK